MATGDKSKELSASIIGGSEEVFEFHCQPCSLDNQHVEAEWFCQDCCEYLCRHCYKVHRKVPATKNHVLQSKEVMPRNKIPVRPKDVLTKVCRKHVDQVIEYWCNKHGQLCCNVCLSFDHRTCSEMSYIPEVSDGITNTKEYKQLLKDLHRLIAMVTVGQKKMQHNGSKIEEFRSEALSDIKKFRKDMDTLLDKLEKDINAQVLKVKDGDTDKVDNALAICDVLLQETTGMLDTVKKKEEEGRNNQLFIELKTVQRHIPAMEKEVKGVIENTRITRYTFEKNGKIEHSLSAPSSLGTLSVSKANVQVQDINVKSSEDTHKCIINGITALPDGRVVVSDQKNKSIKLINVNENKINSRVSLLTIPFDVTAVAEDQVAVALPLENKIEIYSVSNVLSGSPIVTVPERCVSLQYSDTRFVTVDQNPCTVKIIDMNGHILNTFVTDREGQILFKMPRHIALSPDNSMMYVTDSENHTVTCMTVTGEVISVYKGDQLKFPYGVTVDEEGRVYVCSQDNHTVLLLTPTCTRTQVLLEKKDELSNYPFAITYSDHDHRLYISSNSTPPRLRNNLKVFQKVFKQLTL